MITACSNDGISIDQDPGVQIVVDGQLRSWLPQTPTITYRQAPASAAEETRVIREQQERALAAMGTCSGQDCTQDRWRVPPPGIDAWLPAGVVRLFMGRVPSGANYIEPGMQLPFTAFFDANGNLRKSVQKVFSRSEIGPITYDYLVHDRWKGKKFDGTQKLETRYALSFCAQWCRGCITSVYRSGAPTCSEVVEVSPKASWDVYAKQLSGDRLHIALERRDPSGFDKTLDKITDAIDKVTNRICANQSYLNYVPSTDPQTRATVQAMSMVISNACGSQAPPQTPVYTPPPSPAPRYAPAPPSALIAPWYKRPSTYAIAGGVGAAMALAVVLARR